MTDQIFGHYPSTATEAPAQGIPATAAKSSLLDELAKEAQKEIVKHVRYDIENRPGWTAEFRTNIESDDFNRYRRAAQGKKKRPEDMDPSLFTGMALVEYNTGIYKNNVLVEMEDGEPLTFRSKQFQQMFENAYTQVDAVVRFIGSGHAISMGNALYSEAGYGDEVVAVDPTDA